jgi:hypothetical protein
MEARGPVGEADEPGHGRKNHWGVSMMRHPAAVSVLLAALLVVPSIPVHFADGARAAGAVLLVNKEWTSPQIGAWDEVQLNDTDGDGAREVVVWSFMDGSLRIFDSPGYTLGFGANYSRLLSVETQDLGADGSVQLVVGASVDDTHDISFTVLDGKGFSPLWTGPEIPGFVDHRVGDVDGDGRPELVFLGSTLQIYDGTTFQRDWESPPLASPGFALEAANLDSDLAQEVAVATLDPAANQVEILAFDGAGRSLLWTSAPIQNESLVTIMHAGDLDADSVPELVLEGVVQNETAVVRTDFFILSGATGATEWNFSVPGMALPEMADLDRDGSPEYFVEGSELGSIFDSYNVTFSVFDIGERQRSWSLGPFQNTFGPTEMKQAAYRLLDINGDGFEEIAILNLTLNLMTGSERGSLDVFGGADLGQLWGSPDFRMAAFDSSLTGIDPLLPAELDADGTPELVISESWTQPPAGRPHGIVRVYSAATFSEEWNTGDLQSYTFGFGGQLVKDPAPELFVLRMDEQAAWASLIDPSTHQTTWESQRYQFGTLGNITFGNILGGPWNEVLFLGQTDDGTGNVNSTLCLLNDTTLEQSWQSELLEGQAELLALGDIDGDSHAEALLRLTTPDETGVGLSTLIIYDFWEGRPPLPDLAIQAPDLVLSNSTPFAGMPLELRVGLHNLGGGNVTGCAVVLSVDGARWDSRTVGVAPFGQTDVAFNWTSVQGSHTLSVTADPDNLVEETEEGNNGATLSVTVAPRPLPVAMISAPREGESFPEGAKVNFSAAGSRAPAGGDLTYSWTSELSGPLGSQESFAAALPPGLHLITLSVGDGFNRASTAVNITVTPAPPPVGTTSAVISSPRSGAVHIAGDQILFDGTGSVAASAGYRLTFSWSSNQSGQLGNSSRFWKALPAGNHNITLSVDDGHGGRSSAHALLRVRPGDGVVALIRSPQEGEVFEYDQDIVFDGTGSEGPTGSALTFSWEDNVTGPLGTEIRFSRTLPPGDHSVTLTVGDGKGHRAGAVANFTVNPRPNRAPGLSVLSPAEGAVLRGTVQIHGTAGDDIGVEAILISIDGAQPVSAAGGENWSYSWDTRPVANGAHTLTVWASDGALRSPEVTINITVKNAGPAPSSGGNLPGTAVFAALAAVLALVAIAAAAFFARRRKGPEAVEVVAVEEIPVEGAEEAPGPKAE